MLKRFFLLLSSLLLVCNVQAGLFNNKPQYLTAAEAFIFSSSQQDGQLQLHWQIADGYYLYQKEIQLSAQNATLDDVTFPTAEKYQDEFFGEVAIFRDQLKLPVKLTDLKENPSLKIRYQGCTKGFCYPPETRVIPLNPSLQVNNSANSAALPSTIATPNAPQTELAENLSNNYLSIFGFLLLGIGLAFTPCVLPMLPLLSAIVIGHKNRPNTSRALLLSFTYVQGMALTYTLLGLTVVAIGLPFQVALQSPAVLISLAVLFTLLAASMFGLFEIRLPNTWQQKLNALSQQQQGGAVGNVFIMGIIASLVASPCTSAPLSGALLYVAQSGNLLIGGLALYLLALGMGLPLILITVFGNQTLPKSGEWLFKVKTAFGFVMLALPIFLISRILPSHYEPFLWSTLALAFLGWLISSLNYSTILKQAVRILLFIAFGLTAYPWANLVWQTTSNTAQPTTPHLAMEKITSLTELEQKLTAYQGKKVMLDLYADWCVACKEFEKYTFTDPQVQQQLATMAVLQIDMTKNSAENTALMKRFNVLGLPTILFFDENGHEMTNARITGFLTANQFLAWLNGL
ncbi:protein-disulfide reductase DsbD [[Haemophilus] ducreyi]|uniref:protein-disulfide reductase DsbD n=1 Tax=Haemophilus ducreyi TaxID=730 RepID=UPI0006553112|nr:protein-disulfide reductase DsbD [[Haemophilus] ducreyi]AKO45240.1 thiol:disulfide interchange protein [[Haemophilus] ducreyi]AKO46642.1 thiol:disulfide interchange protein [[Haemophilus] ducreyi]AKO47983.1 thiol:disulfide interchange protein [[Haemophilus] ducreyi]AKO49371.1 thiol:disulfide interchange protein [[Haemophilus] ducreyi]ANF61591.1 protein-disulfide reductase DsbD [[Haemophilus] ducreyi]